MKKSLYTLLLGLLLLTSCSEYNKLLKTNDIECKYEAAKAYFIGREYGKAAPLLEDIVSMLKGNRNAEESLYMLAMCYYESGDYETASQYFKTYYTSYQRGIYNELARFHCGKALYKNIPVPELDQTSTHSAIQEFQLFLEYYPATQFRQEAQDMLFNMYEILAKKDYLSAKLYYDLGSFDLMRNNYQACIITAQNILKEYPYTKLREDLSILILRAKYKMALKSVEDKKVDRYRDAVDEYYAFKNEFPESKYLDEAEKYYKESLEKVNE